MQQMLTFNGLIILANIAVKLCQSFQILRGKVVDFIPAISAIRL